MSCTTTPCANACAGCPRGTATAASAPRRASNAPAQHNHALPVALQRWAAGDGHPPLELAQCVQLHGFEIADPGDTVQPLIALTPTVDGVTHWLTPSQALDLANALRQIALAQHARLRPAQEGARA